MINTPHKKLKMGAKALCLVTVLLSQLIITPTEAASWKRPVLLSSNDATQPDAAIDSTGNIVSVWVEKPDANGTGQIWTKSRRNGIWSAAAALDPTIDSHHPKVEISATGNAMAIWINSTGIWSADRPAGKAWMTPKLLVPMPIAGLGRSKFSMNSKGDALLTWVEGGSYGVSVNFIKRTGNGSWSSSDVIVAKDPLLSEGVDLIESIIGENSDALTGWVSYTISPRSGAKGAAQLQVSRLTKTGTMWQTSLALGVVDNTYYYDVWKTSLLLDAQGRAGVIYYMQDPNDVLIWNWAISTQTAAGQPWSAASIIPIDVSDTTCDQLMLLPDISGCFKESGIEGSARNDAKGNITFMFTDRYQYDDFFGGTYYAFRVKNVTSSLNLSLWSKPAPLLAYDDTSFNWTYGTYYSKYDIGSNGTGVFAWPWTDATTLSPLLKVKQRSGATGSWKSSLSYNFNTPNNAGSVLNVKVNSIGNASILYDNFDSINHLLYVVTYN